MDKVYTYLMIVVSISFLLWAAGYGSSGSMFNVISILKGGGTWEATALWIFMLGALGSLAGLAAYQSFVAGNASAATAAGAAAMSLFLITFIADIVHLISLADVSNCSKTVDAGLCGVSFYLITFPCILLALGFGWSIWQHTVGGGD